MWDTVFGCLNVSEWCERDSWIRKSSNGSSAIVRLSWSLLQLSSYLSYGFIFTFISHVVITILLFLSFFLSSEFSEHTVTVLLVSSCRLTESEAADHRQGRNLCVWGTVRVKKHKLRCANQSLGPVRSSSSSAVSQLQIVWERRQPSFSSSQRISNRLQRIQQSSENNSRCVREKYKVVEGGGDFLKTEHTESQGFTYKTASKLLWKKHIQHLRKGVGSESREGNKKKSAKGTAWRCVHACVCVFSEPKEKQQCGDMVNTTREPKCQQITTKGTQGRRKKRKLAQGRFLLLTCLV